MRDEKSPERKIVSKGYRTRNIQVMRQIGYKLSYQIGFLCFWGGLPPLSHSPLFLKSREAGALNNRLYNTLISVTGNMQIWVIMDSKYVYLLNSTVILLVYILYSKTPLLTLSSIYIQFNTLKEKALGKHCGKR